MFRRDMLSTVAAGSLGMFSGIDQVDFEALAEDLEDDFSDQDVIQNFSMQGEGATKTTGSVIDWEADPDCGQNDTPPNAQVFEHAGSLNGWFKGAYKGVNISMQQDFVSPPLMQATVELIKPASELAKSSSYYVVWQGLADGGPSDFSVELPFKSIRATGEFEGTAIKGTFKSKSAPGYPIQFKMEGVQVNDQ